MSVSPQPGRRQNPNISGGVDFQMVGVAIPFAMLAAPAKSGAMM